MSASGRLRSKAGEGGRSRQGSDARSDSSAFHIYLIKPTRYDDEGYPLPGQRRPATEDEAAALAVRLKPFRRTKGARMIWSRLQTVRDIHFDRFEPVIYPKVTDGLWIG